MKLYKRDFNYWLYYTDSQYQDDDLQLYDEDFGQDITKGIFKLSLGHRHYAAIHFLPKIENIHESWPPHCDYRTIQSTDDISIALLYGELYNVIPCNEWAGQVKILEPEIKEKVLPYFNDGDFIRSAEKKMKTGLSFLHKP